MTEKLLQYIWQFQHFSQSSLQTTSGDNLLIISPGKLNRDQGPDFLNAQVRIESTLFAGSIELHIKTSQWIEHGHESDPNYKNVILHVVFENDLADFHLPVLELQPRISNLLLDRYVYLMSGTSFIPCGNAIAGVKEITWLSWKERLLAERLTRRSEFVFKLLQQNNNHWEESFWWMLARNFGVKVNADLFEQLARSISVNLLAKHKHQVIQVESLLFGQAGLLNRKFEEDYPQLLQREFRFLRKKYELKPVHMPVHFLRMRPGNFPTVRLAQLAALVCQSSHLFSRVLETDRLQELRNLFEATANDYWHYHYRFDETSVFMKKQIGKDMIDNLVINTVVPMVYAYGLYQGEEKYRLKALCWLEEAERETNAITRGFEKLGIESGNAFDSQALVELKTRYCDEKQCLNCSVGNSILRST